MQWSDLAVPCSVAFVKTILISNGPQRLFPLTAILHFPESCHSNYPHFSVGILSSISQIILYAPTFGIHVKTATTHKDIGLTTTFSTTCEWICFPSSSANRPTTCMHWEARKRWITTCRRCHVEHALSILYAFASSIYVNEAVATNKFNSKRIWMIDHELD
jgi:hypothetical protein